MNSVFVSASVPDPRRDPRYFETADNIAIRDAITALVQVVTPLAQLVFGGHPAITPMVARVARAQGTLENVLIFQSAEFAPIFPPENSAFRSLIITEKRETRSRSLELMRERMLAAGPFAAAIFIGGMEGVEEEFAAVRRLPEKPPCFPIATTGAAALRLAQEHRSTLSSDVAEALFTDYDFHGLFRRLFGLTALDEGAVAHG